MPPKPKTWSPKDIPTPAEMEGYLGRIQSVRDMFPGVSGFPILPPNMDNLTIQGANDIERTLLVAYEIIELLMQGKSIIYSGELQSGGF